MEDWVEIWLFGLGLTKRKDLHLFFPVLWLLQTSQLSKKCKISFSNSIKVTRIRS